MKTKGINWASRIAKEEKAAVITNLRTKLSERKPHKPYTGRDKNIYHLEELDPTKRTLGDGNSERRDLNHSAQ